MYKVVLKNIIIYDVQGVLEKILFVMYKVF